MNAETLEKQFKSSVCSDIELVKEGIDRFQIFTPFRFDDGDHYVTVLKKRGDRWIISDEGHTLMHLSYSMDVDNLFGSGNRSEIFHKALTEYSTSENDGELYIEISDDNSYGNALYSIIQAISKVYDVLYLSREVVKSTFMDDLKQEIHKLIPKNAKVTSKWHDSTDTNMNYVVDYKIEHKGKRPIFLFGLNGNQKIDDATITILWLEKKYDFFSIGIYEDQEKYSRKSVAKMTDACDRTFSSLPTNINKIRNVIAEQIDSSAKEISA
ncbi:MAG: DUF1828 domain-containing protein [Methanomicrobium sp.]|nr:DUF1828 domain-containing protein [Methanomicrobium sp.]